MSFKTGSNHIHLFKQGHVETEWEGMKDTQSERGTVVRGLMRELAVFTQAVESRHKHRDRMNEGVGGMANSKLVYLYINTPNSQIMALFISTAQAARSLFETGSY